MRNFILGTDWGEDVDDCLATRILLRAHKRGEINLLGIGINTRVEESCPSLYAFMENEGVIVPIGVDKDLTHVIESVTYQKILAPMAPSLTNDNFEDAVRLYRRLIANAEGKVEILEVGFMQVINGALMSEPDDISEKSGMELFSEKVERVWTMGGKWNEQGGLEYNYSKYQFTREATHNFVDKCPCPITFLGWEVGSGLITGDTVEDEDLLAKLLIAWGGEKGRESWDPMLVTLALAGSPEKAGYCAVCGTATVDEQGRNYFKEGEGMHQYVIKAQPDSYYKDIINNLIK